MRSAWTEPNPGQLPSMGHPKTPGRKHSFLKHTAGLPGFAFGTMNAISMIPKSRAAAGSSRAQLRAVDEMDAGRTEFGA